MQNSKLLANGLITAEQFLDRIVYQQKEDDFGLLNVEFVNILIDEEDDEDNEGENNETSDSSSEEEQRPASQASTSTQKSNNSVNVGKCKICSISQVEMCLLPCVHFCICERCWNVLEQNRNRTKSVIKCPLCESVVDNAKKIIFNS